MGKFKDYQKFNNQEYRENIVWNSGISVFTLHNEQNVERTKYDEKEVASMVSDSFKTVSKAVNILSANGLFLKYAGPTIQDNFDLVRIACNENGNAIKYASKRILNDPDMASTLILSALYGHPCESYRKVIKDENIILEVSKKIVEKNNNMVDWVNEHMYRDNSPQEFKEFCGSAKRR